MCKDCKWKPMEWMAHTPEDCPDPVNCDHEPQCGDCMIYTVGLMLRLQGELRN